MIYFECLVRWFLADLFRYFNDEWNLVGLELIDLLTKNKLGLFGVHLCVELWCERWHSVNFVADVIFVINFVC